VSASPTRADTSTTVAPMPLRRGSDADLAALRGLLARARYTERDLCERLKLDLIHEIDSRTARVRLGPFDDGDAQAVLIRLFMLGNALPVAVFEQGFEAAERKALLAVDLVRIDTGENGSATAVAPVRWIPVTTSGVSLVLATDRSHGPDWRALKSPSDVVFPPQSYLTRQFLSVLPTPSRGSVLDLCTGSGVAAMLSGHRVERVVAVDVAPRSGHFARFNAWMNRMPQVDVRVGDLYAPLGDERFNWILAHPPYVPTFRPTALFRDGGELGDTIVRAIIQGLPRHLERGGTCYIVCQGMDTVEGRFEENVRRWMGAEGEAFDVVFALSQPRTLENLAATLVEGAVNPEHDQEERALALFREHGVSRFVHGALVLRRLAEGEKGESQRVKVHGSSRAASFDSVFRWMASGREPRFLERLMASTPKVAEGTTLDVVNVFADGEFTPRSFRLANRGVPFPATIEADPWVVRLVMALDGRTSLADALERVRESGHLPARFSQADADVVLRFLAERGVLEIELPS
jgi:methylase of polypeptide subunit release factors